MFRGFWRWGHAVTSLFCPPWFFGLSSLVLKRLCFWAWFFALLQVVAVDLDWVELSILRAFSATMMRQVMIQRL
ncbi:hypothetical protein J3E69DRAFT_342026 [Trichoderma sp. SZMC 28015]